jgi:hypothetical protein
MMRPFQWLVAAQILRYKTSSPPPRTWATPYTITCYPAPYPDEGFRKISVEIVTDIGKKYRVRARPGCRPRGGF